MTNGGGQPTGTGQRRENRIGVRLTAYVLAVAALAAATSAAVLNLYPMEAPIPWFWLGALGLVVFLAQGFPIQWSPQSKADVSTAPLFAGALLLAPPAATAAAGMASVASGLWRRRPAAETVFSSSEVMIEVSLAGLFFHGLTRAGLPAAAGSPLGLVAVAGAGAIFYLVNTSLVAGIMSVEMKKVFASVWLSMHRQVSAVEVVLFALGFLAALLAVSYPWALVLAAAPLLLCYWLFKGVAEKAALSNTLEQQLSQLKSYEAELVQAAKLSSVGTLASGVAHEINNPLFVVMGRAEILLQSPELFLKSDKARQHVAVIHDMGKRIEAIVGGLLGYTRCRDEAGPVDLSEAADEVLLLVEHELRTHKVSVTTAWSAEPALAWGNRSEIQQVCMNLVLNARDAMPQGGCLTVRTAAVDGKVSLAVSDNGSGMAREVMEHLFEPFFTTKEPGKGTGLGLYLSQRIVERHHGQMAVASEAGRGSCFEAVFPRLPLEEATRREGPRADRSAVAMLSR